MNYLSNKELLLEIQKSKNSFCEFLEKKYEDYDLIVENHEDCFKIENIEKAKQIRLIRIKQNILLEEKSKNPNAKMNQIVIDESSIKLEDLVFRIYTYEHIPDAPGRKKNPKTIADTKIKLNFIPFIHVNIIDNKLNVVGKSHTKNGQFSLTHGSITPKLAKMFMLLSERIGQKGNWRGYSYLDEMKGQALMQFSLQGLMFNEMLSDNPFAYYTTMVKNSFTRILNNEKEHQELRDKILIDNGFNPSFSAQLSNEDHSGDE